MSTLIATVSMASALFVGGLGSCTAQQQDRSTAVIQLRLAQENPAPGFVYMAAVTQDGGFYVAEQSIVTDEDIEEARAFRRGGGLVIDVRLSPDGAARLSEVTSGHIGGRLAVVLASRLISAPVIFSTVGTTSHRHLTLGALDLPPDLSDEIAAAVSDKWPTPGGRSEGS